MPPISVQAKIVEERWTPTTIDTTFVFSSVPRKHSKYSGVISIDLPLLKLGWHFALLLKSTQKSKLSSTYTPSMFSFRRHDSAIPWGSTSIRAELSLTGEQPSIFGTPQHELCGAMDIVLADTPSFELPLTTPHTFSIRQLNKVCLTVTITDCPLADGLFQARSGINESELQAQLVRQSGDHLLSRSLTTGKLFDVKFLTPSARPIASRNAGEPLPTYASLSVLERHIDMSSPKLSESWTNAFAVLDKTGTKYGQEVSCEDEYEYELDSDFEDEDEASAPPIDLTPLEDQQSENGTERSTSSFSSFELEKASDQGSVNDQLEEIINVKSLKQLQSDPDCDRTITIKFAAHRTWHAFLWYCYTGNLKFSKLKSQAKSEGSYLRVTPIEGDPPACSPKSMYRLADLVGDNVLKVKALAAIKENMTEENVVDEAFSVFTSKYPEVQEIQLGALMEHCGSPKVKKAFLGAMEKYSGMPHAKLMLSAFYDSLVV